MFRRMLLMLAGATLFVQGATAAIQYEFHQTRHSEAKGIESMDMTGRGVIDGDRSRIDFSGGVGPFTPGTYIIATDNAHLVTYVDPKSKTYAELNVSNMAAAVGSGRVSVANLKSSVDKLTDHPTLLGFPTEHTRITITYLMTMTFNTISLKQNVKTVIDKWTTGAFGDVTDTFFAAGAQHTGNPELDSVIDAETMKVKGLPLRQMVQITTTSENGRLADSKLQFDPSRHQIMEITLSSVRATAVGPSFFKVPLGYSKKDSTNEPEAMPMKTLSLEPVSK